MDFQSHSSVSTRIASEKVEFGLLYKRARHGFTLKVERAYKGKTEGLELELLTDVIQVAYQKLVLIASTLLDSPETFDEWLAKGKIEL